MSKGVKDEKEKKREKSLWRHVRRSRVQDMQKGGEMHEKISMRTFMCISVQGPTLERMNVHAVLQSRN